MEFIVGTALAGIPIVLEAYDRYWDLSAGLNSLRNYSRELVKLDTILKTQKTLLRGNAIRLLTAITKDPQKARDLLSSSSGTDRWTDFMPLEVHEANRLEYLRETFSSWEATLGLVQSAVTTICLEVESFRSSNSHAAYQPTPPRELLKQLPRRFRLCWKKQEIQDAIKELRDFTMDFNELTTRIVDEIGEMLPPCEASAGQNALHLNSLEKYRHIRTASRGLYNTLALRWSCSRHQKHAASINIVEPESLTRARETKDGIKFGVAISCETDSPSYDEAPIWLEVESIESASTAAKEKHQQKSASDESWESMIGTLLKHSGPVVTEKAERISRKLVKKSVRFQTTSDSAENTAAGTSTVTITQPHNSGEKKDDNILTLSAVEALIDLEMIEDICQHFQISRPICAYTCVGYIQDRDLYRFYLAPPEPQLSGEQKSLADIIDWVAEDEFSRGLPRIATARLASSLAAAVLQYHSTPWLPETWQSSHVRFFGTSELAQDGAEVISSAPPYFKVEFSNPDIAKATDLGAGHEEAGDTAPTLDDPSTAAIPARNELLFRLGIVLLELAYNQPWRQLRRRALAGLQSSRKRTDYHAAERLAQAVALRDRLGPRFPTVVRKCLGCDFGLGECDLASEELQGSFLVDIVEALQAVERELRELERRLGQNLDRSA